MASSSNLESATDRKEFVLTDVSEKVQRVQLACNILNKVAITSIVNYNHIFVQKMDLESASLLKNVEDLDLRYASLKKPKSLPEPIAVNTLCVVNHDGRFYRALTVNVGQNSCHVMFADFGGVKEYPNEKMYLPLLEFVEHPLLAIECIIDQVFVSCGNQQFEQAAYYTNVHLITGEHFVAPIAEDDSGLLHVALYIKFD